MSQLIDRRLNGKNKSAVNRRRFLRRYKQQIKRAVSDAMGGRSIEDVDKGETVNIPAKDISEPVFQHGSGGSREVVCPGNKEYVPGDTVPRPQGGKAGAGGRAGNGEGGEDEFVFQLSREEFLEFFFDELELPDLVKTNLRKIVDFKTVRAGYTTNGVPANINIIRSLKQAHARRIALRAPHRTSLRQAEARLSLLRGDTQPFEPGDDEEIRGLEIEILELRKRIERVPFIDTFDIRYNLRHRQPTPSSQAVMFCVMDVSGSMDQERKDIAKRFFTLLYLFLTRHYERTDIVFIRHHTTAREVDENEFFYSRETGGTVVSSALDLMHGIQAERYPASEWNVYGAQASDGDNWSGDSPKCRDLLTSAIMPAMQYYAYVDIRSNQLGTLWREYLNVKKEYPNFAMEKIDGPADIYPVFRNLFKRQNA